MLSKSHRQPLQSQSEPRYLYSSAILEVTGQSWNPSAESGNKSCQYLGELSENSVYRLVHKSRRFTATIRTAAAEYCLRHSNEEAENKSDPQETLVQ